MRKFYTAVLAVSLISTGASAYNVKAHRTGATATVAPAHAPKFQCLVNALEHAGYKIKFMGGYRKHGSVRHSKHPSGRALDINQTARGKVIRPFPPGTNAMARRCGLFHGDLWRNDDTGHFETRDPYMKRYIRRHKRSK